VGSPPPARLLDRPPSTRFTSPVRQLPTGTLTFLFTDIEGSTRLLHELGAERYAEALAEHRRLLREAFAEQSGVEVDTQGDAFFVAFADAGAALAAAEASTRALEGGPIRVRMGVHTGEPLRTDEGYVGSDVHRAARIAAAAHGGQVVVSEATRLAAGVELRPLGAHRLKDLIAPEPLWQLGEGDFPPLASLNQSTLPVQPTPFLGRERELAEVLDLLGREGVRLLTLVGAGGSGKTRLALQAAAAVIEDYPHGVWWVPLQAVRDPELVEPAIAQALGATVQLTEHVADRKLLVLLDNFEQVIDAAPIVASVLAACPNAKVLVTSRELLRVAAERVYAVPPFVEQEGVGFFLARARAVRQNVESGPEVRELCRRLDNLPLALELAAARLNALEPAELLARLGRRLQVLTSGPRDAPERQRTLRATIEWSHDLLTPGEQLAFRRLAVFVGGWTLTAAEEVCEADIDDVASLVEKSLVRLSDGRYSMLETIQEYAGELFDASGEAEAVRRRHAEYFLVLADASNLSVEAIEARGGPRHDLVLPDEDNLRAALDWAEQADPELGLRIAIALEMHWVTRHTEAVRRIEALCTRPDELAPELRARALRLLGGVYDIEGDAERAEEAYEDSLAVYEELGDEWGAVHLQHRLAVVAYMRGDADRVRRLAEDCLSRARAHGFKLPQAEALGDLANVAEMEGDLEAAAELTLEALELARELRIPWFEAIDLESLADLSLRLGRVEAASEHARSALAVCRQIDDRLNTLISLALVALVARARGDALMAAKLLGAVEAEEARAPLGRWEPEVRRLAERISAGSDAAFEEARVRGQALSFDEAIAEALAG
jgi:predicted ATPase/class 3 adenylate cyclase